MLSLRAVRHNSYNHGFYHSYNHNQAGVGIHPARRELREGGRTDTYF